MRYRTDSYWLLGVIAVIYTASFFIMERWPTLAYGGDAWGYYVHLPATLIHGDVGDYETTIQATGKYEPYMVNPKIDMYGVRETPIGKFNIKYPVGVALLELPFFGIAHTWAHWSGGEYAPDGYSRPYMMLIGLGGIFYALLGLWLLWHILIRYFPRRTAVALVLIIGLGTNLYYFGVYNNVMSHAFLFFLHAGLILASIRFWEKPGSVRAAWIGVWLGMIAITRTQELMAAAIPVLWGISSWDSARERWQFFVRHWQWLAVAAVAFLVVLVPQLVYWKYVSGSWVYFSYKGETFDFRHPHIWGGLTSFRNGWLIYTPVMLFALLGLVRLRKAVPAAWWPFLVFFPLHLYITYSWWCWYYINGFGSRPMVETYALLALLLGAFWQWGSDFIWKKALNWSILVFFIWLNIFQTWQLREGILWSQDGNRAYYTAIFGTLHPDRDALIAYESGESQPGSNIKFVQALAETGFEDSSSVYHISQPVFAGKFAFKSDEEFSPGLTIPGNTAGIQPGDRLRVSVQGFVPGADKIWDRDRLARLSVEFRGADDQVVRIRSMRISNKIGNPKNSIWETGETDRWGEAAFFVKVPSRFRTDGTIKVYIWNPQGQKLIVDDLKLALWR